MRARGFYWFERAGEVACVEAVFGWEKARVESHFGSEKDVDLPSSDAFEESFGVGVSMEKDVEIAHVAPEDSCGVGCGCV